MPGNLYVPHNNGGKIHSMRTPALVDVLQNIETILSPNSANACAAHNHNIYPNLAPCVQCR